jgi:hypothetical protein
MCKKTDLLLLAKIFWIVIALISFLVLFSEINHEGLLDHSNNERILFSRILMIIPFSLLSLMAITTSLESHQFLSAPPLFPPIYYN